MSMNLSPFWLANKPIRFCPDCRVAIGEIHKAGCDVERCQECGEQKISCDCTEYTRPAIPWTGQWPGDAECREFGWWSRWVDGTGWVKCNALDDGASPDLNRLSVDAEWDADAGRFVLKS